MILRYLAMGGSAVSPGRESERAVVSAAVGMYHTVMQLPPVDAGLAVERLARALGSDVLARAVLTLLDSCHDLLDRDRHGDDPEGIVRATH